MDDDYDDMPELTISTSRKFESTSTFTMPPANVLALERARELECERQLQLQRKAHAAEAEAKAQSPPRPSPATPPNAAQLIAKLLQHLPENYSDFIRDYLQVLQQGNSAKTRFVTSRVLEGLEGAVVGEHCAWDGGSIVCSCAWLCVVAMAGVAAEVGAGVGLRARHALYALLQRATDQQIETLSHVMSETLASPQLLMSLCDAVYGAPGAPTTLSNRLLQIALDRASSAVGGAGSAASVATRITWARLWGRATARLTAPPPPLPSHALQPPPGASRTDKLKLKIEATRLKLLLEDNKEQAANMN